MGKSSQTFPIDRRFLFLRMGENQRITTKLDPTKFVSLHEVCEAKKIVSVKKRYLIFPFCPDFLSFISSSFIGCVFFETQQVRERNRR